MADNTLSDEYNTLLNITNENIDRIYSTTTPHKVNGILKSPLKSAIKPATPYQHTHSSPQTNNVTYINHTQQPNGANHSGGLDDKSAQILHVLDHSRNEIERILESASAQHNALQQQYDALRQEHNALKQAHADTKQYAETVKRDVDEQLKQAHDAAIQHKHTQNLHILHRLTTAQRTYTVSVVYGAWKAAYYKHVLRKQKHSADVQLKRNTEHLTKQFESQLSTLNDTVAQQQHDIAAHKLNEHRLNEKLKMALLRSVCAVNSEALQILNDPLCQLSDLPVPRLHTPMPHAQPLVGSGVLRGRVSEVPKTVRRVNKVADISHINIVKQAQRSGAQTFR